MDYSRPQLADRLAAEYVAGTLRGPARRRFESLLPAHPMLREATRAWQARLMPLTAPITPVQPSGEVWRRISERIGGETPATRGGAWNRLPFWRGLAAFASVAAIGLAVLLANPTPLPPGRRPSERGGSGTVALRGKVLTGTDTLAVSLEPAGGSPTGQPTGPILYAGKFSL